MNKVDFYSVQHTVTQIILKLQGEVMQINYMYIYIAIICLYKSIRDILMEYRSLVGAKVNMGRESMTKKQ